MEKHRKPSLCDQLVLCQVYQLIYVIFSNASFVQFCAYFELDLESLTVKFRCFCKIMEQQIGLLCWLAISVCFGCTVDFPPGVRTKDRHGHESDIVKVQYSDVVAVGKVSVPVSGDFPWERYDGMYTVRFEVSCTFKGGNIPSLINIAGMGKNVI